MSRLRSWWRSYRKRRAIKQPKPQPKRPFWITMWWRVPLFFFQWLIIRPVRWLRHSFLSRLFKRILDSLWFRLVGAFAIVILLILFILLNVIDEVTTRAFAQYVNARNSYVQSLLEPTAEPEAAPNPSATEIAPPPTPISPSFDEIVISIRERRNRSSTFFYSRELRQIVDQLYSETDALQFLTEVRQGVQTAVIAAGIVAVFLGTLISFQITRPLMRLRKAAQAYADGDWEVRVPVKKRDEIGKVAESFNQMAQKLGEQEQLRRQMVADVAHELRTPLTVMKSNLEAMLDGLLEPDATELSELHDEVQRLTRLIDDLRFLSLADAGQLTLYKQTLDVCDLLKTVVTRLAALAQMKDVELICGTSEVPLFVYADGDKLQQAFNNLIDNAIRHTPDGGCVRVTAVSEKKMVHITVADTGPGIPAEELPYLFDRFWRSDKSRSRDYGGSGIGLSIVKQVAELHEGSVQVVSPDKMGASFTISLPLAD